ncbi:MAG: hypothetical protein AAFO07_16105 [Bacteroidota bacterium]
MDANNSTSETHHLFPSGEWEGFYTYAYGPTAVKHPMSIILNFANGVVSGAGNDDVGPFSWDGAYDLEALTCKMNKFYPSHSVYYDGRVDENGIWGTWFLSFGSGGFHIWPKSNGNKEEEEEEESVMVEELIEEIKEIKITNCL